MEEDEEMKPPLLSLEWVKVHNSFSKYATVSETNGFGTWFAGMSED